MICYTLFGGCFSCVDSYELLFARVPRKEHFRFDESIGLSKWHKCTFGEKVSKILQDLTMLGRQWTVSLAQLPYSGTRSRRKNG